MAKKHGGNTVSLIWTLAEPIARSLGLTLWDIVYVKEGTQWYLRIYIDKEGGVSIDDCEAMSRAVDEPLDTLDPIEQSYCLEVSSPGLERELCRPAHFLACTGLPVAAKFFAPLESGAKEAGGILKEYREDGTVVLETAQGTLAFSNKACTKIYVDDFNNGGNRDE